MAKGGDPSPVQPLYVGGNAYCGVPVAEQERDVVHIDAPLTIAVEESDDGPVVSVEVPAALASERVPIVGTADLGTPRIVEALYENPNGTPILFDADGTPLPEWTRYAPFGGDAMRLGQRTRMIRDWSTNVERNALLQWGGAAAD